MSGRSWTQWCGQALTVVVAAMALSASAAWAAAEPHPHVGKLPGFPVIRGVMPVLGSKAAVGAHEKLVNEAFAEVRERRSQGTKGAGEPESNEEFFSPCVDEVVFYSTQDVCYRGGPVLHDPTIHLIFWQGPVSPLTEHVGAISLEYMKIVEHYFEDVAAASNSSTNVFAVDRQYGEEDSHGKYIEGEYALTFDPSTDVTVSNDAFPVNGVNCVDKTEYSEGPCLLDSDLHAEITKVAKAHTPQPWPLESSNDENIYVVLTPPGVGGCFDKESSECAYKAYCAYHGDYGGDGETPGKQTIYADLPYIGEVPGCDAGIHPNEPVSRPQEEKGEDFGADAVIDVASHELNESITDPLGSQCKEKAKKASECERNAWTDVIGQEVGDKCLPPEVTIDGVYGEPLGELLAGREASLYNQEIGGHVYWTQREWSNEAGLFEGGCVQRAIGASFTVSTNPQATVPTTLDGSGSGAAGDPAVYWVWNIFNTGEQFGAESPTLSHAFATAGEYLVGLTAYDRYGNAEATLESFTVGAAPPPAPPTPPTVIKEVIVPGHYTAAQVSAALGLPANGKKLSGFGPFALGHATCPPACGVTLQLYGKETKVVHGHRRSKWVLIGGVHVTVSANHSATLTLKPSAQGKALLHKIRGVPARLVVTVEGREGGTWQMVRALTVTANGTAARRARR